MAKQKSEIEVDVPDGWEATGEWRPARQGEAVIHPDHCHAFVMNTEGMSNRIILRKKYVPPSWLKPGTWLFQTESGIWYASRSEPNGTKPLYSYGPEATLHRDIFPDFVPPPTNPYQIPEAK